MWSTWIWIALRVSLGYRVTETSSQVAGIWPVAPYLVWMWRSGGATPSSPCLPRVGIRNCLGGTVIFPLPVSTVTARCPILCKGLFRREWAQLFQEGLRYRDTC